MSKALNLRLILLLTTAMEMSAAAESGPKPSMRAILAEEIKKQVVYTPPAAKEPAATLPPDSGGELVVMEPFTVTAPADPLAGKIAERQKKILSEKFTVTTGGTIMKNEGKRVTSEFKILFNPDHGGWDLLSFSW